MLAAVLFFDRDLRHFAGRGQDKIRVSDPIFAAIGHPDDERLEGSGV